MTRFDAIADAIADLRRGGMVVVCHGEDEKSEGDLLVLAEYADPERINFMAREARGLISLALTAERSDELGLEPISRRGGSCGGHEHAVSIEARDGVSTGISAHDRAHTVRTAIDPARGPDDIVQPGHVLPLRARSGGLLEATGRAEVATELARAAGQVPAAVISEILNEDGSSAKLADLFPYARGRGLRIVSVADLIRECARELEDTGVVVPMGRSGQAMRAVMGQFATGVTVVTARSAAGEPVGTTVNAFTSVSLRPPLLLVCLAQDSLTLAAVRESGRFAVNVLGSHQEHHSSRFAARGEEARAHEVQFGEHGPELPVIPDAMAVAACRVDATHPAGDHEIVVGEVLSSSVGREDVSPLLFFRGTYHSLAAPGAELRREAAAP
ncbi:MAG: 3,4-dihydroxy-2-butanone-4-phosphate synthase [Actinobacteria bacterium]|nr:3,4-dihydroxy-2-butanone-4-phosphate synthase [Actinomycetota bacterium]